VISEQWLYGYRRIIVCVITMFVDVPSVDQMLAKKYKPIDIIFVKQ